jgi:hypothetical protein
VQRLARSLGEAGGRLVGRVDASAGEDVDVGQEGGPPVTTPQEQLGTVRPLADEDEAGGVDRLDDAGPRQGRACWTASWPAAAVMP